MYFLKMYFIKYVVIIWTGSDLALMNTDVILCFQEVTMWNAQVCEDLVKHCTATSMVACIFPTCILIKAQDQAKQSLKIEQMK